MYCIACGKKGVHWPPLTDQEGTPLVNSGPQLCTARCGAGVLIAIHEASPGTDWAYCSYCGQHADGHECPSDD